MRVLCEINNIFELDDSNTVERLKKYIYLSDGQLNLEKNKEYCVYGVAFRDNAPWYYLCLDEYDVSPTAYPAELFRITDGHLSSYWRLLATSIPDGVMSSMVFEEWAQDFSFYERLVDDDPEAVELFSKYRQLMEQE